MSILEFLDQWIELNREHRYVVFDTELFNRWWRWRLTQRDLSDDCTKNTPCSVAEAIRFYNSELANENNS